MKKFTSIAVAALTLIIFVSSCHRDDDTTARCPGTAVASWKVGGAPYESYVYVYTHVGTVSNFTLTACVSDANDKIVQMVFIPYPPVVGSHPLKWDGMGVWNSFGSGQYITDDDGNYVTDSTTYTGSFDITSINTANKTITGGFHFSAQERGGSRTVDVTDGVFTNMKYE
jgi:hypothetical protein